MARDLIELRLDAPEVSHFHIQGRQVWVKTDRGETVVRVPRAVRSRITTYGKRSVIRAGSVLVSGPTATLQPLWDTIVDTTPTK